MATPDELRQRIQELIEKYTRWKDEKGERGLKELSEANVRKDFIDPLFEVLGWSVRDSHEYDSERYIRGVGFADVAVKLNGKPVKLIFR